MLLVQEKESDRQKKLITRNKSFSVKDRVHYQPNIVSRQTGEYLL